MDGWKDREGGGIGWAPLGDGMKLRTEERHIGIAPGDRRRRTILDSCRIHPPHLGLCSCCATPVEQEVGWVTNIVGRHGPATVEGILSSERRDGLTTTARCVPPCGGGGGDGSQREEFGAPTLLHAAQRPLLLHSTVWLQASPRAVG